MFGGAVALSDPVPRPHVVQEEVRVRVHSLAVDGGDRRSKR